MIDTRSAALRMQPVLAVLLGLAVAGCGPKNEYQAPPPPEVTVARPVSQVISRSLQFTGTTSPVEKVEIRARVSGYLDKVAFTDGMNVEAGELLFVIDQAPFQTALRQAEATQRLAEARVESSLAEFDKARAEAENAQAQLARGERAARGGAVTEGELDDLRTTRDAAYASAKAAQAAIASSRAEVEAAAAQVASAKLDLSYTEVRSPIKGRVGEAEVDVGNLVGASDPTLLTTVVRYNPINAYYTISEADLLMWIGWVEEGKDYTRPGERATKEFPLYLGLSNEEGFPHEGRYDYADLAIARSTGTYLLRGVFDNSRRRIPPGAFVRVKVPLQEEEALLIDERAIGRDQGGTYALVVVDKPAGPTVERRSVNLAEAYERMRIVESGLTTADRVVVNGLQRARPGAVVRPVEVRPVEATPAAEGGGGVAEVSGDAEMSGMAGTTAPTPTPTPTTGAE